MPKLKTHKTSRLRFKVTRNGKVLRTMPGRRHLLSGKSGKRRRQMRGRSSVHKPYGEVIRRLLGPNL